MVARITIASAKLGIDPAFVSKYKSQFNIVGSPHGHNLAYGGPAVVILKGLLFNVISKPFHPSVSLGVPFDDETYPVPDKIITPIHVGYFCALRTRNMTELETSVVPIDLTTIPAWMLQRSSIPCSCVAFKQHICPRHRSSAPEPTMADVEEEFMRNTDEVHRQLGLFGTISTAAEHFDAA